VWHLHSSSSSIPGMPSVPPPLSTLPTQCYTHRDACRRVVIHMVAEGAHIPQSISQPSSSVRSFGAYPFTIKLGELTCVFEMNRLQKKAVDRPRPRYPRENGEL
jgi:hypothetical protein